MTLHLELTEEQSRLILDSASRRDEAALRQILGQAFEATIRELLFSPPASPERDPFESIARRLQASFAAEPGHHPLSPQALTREGHYDDHA